MAHLRLSGCFDWWIFMDGTRLTYLTSYFCIQRSWNSITLATWCEELTHWKRAWCWERLRAGGEGDNRRWDGWMASPIQWTWVWVNSRSWWWTGRPGMLWFMGSQRVRHDWAIELNWRTICVFCLEMTHVQIILNYRLTHITPVLFSSSALVTEKKKVEPPRLDLQKEAPPSFTNSSAPWVSPTHLSALHIFSLLWPTHPYLCPQG